MSQTRTIRAASSREALRQVRIEMGDDAVILSNRRVGDQVELVAAAPDMIHQLAQQEAEAGQLPLLVQELRRLQAEIQGHMDVLQRPRSSDSKQEKIRRSLSRLGFGGMLIDQLLEHMPAHAELSWITQVLERNLRVLNGDRAIIQEGGVFALVGPTGVGKTTTTAKIAARAVVRYGADQVGLITTDSYRVGAHEQLRIYGRILGVAVHTVKDGADLKLTLDGLRDKKIVLIDTMGLGQRDQRVPDQTQQLDALGVRRILLLNATANLQTLEDVVRVYRHANLLGCLPTKLDEALSMGGIVDVMIRHRLALCYVAHGQRVPEDLREVNVGALLQATFHSLESVGLASEASLNFDIGQRHYA